MGILKLRLNDGTSSKFLGDNQISKNKYDPSCLK